MSLWTELAKLKSATWVELSPSPHQRQPVLGRHPGGLGGTLPHGIRLRRGDAFLPYPHLQVPRQFGTHVDFPNHFTPGAVGSEAYGATDMVMPLVVIDLTPKIAQQGPDVAITVEDIEAWESEHGRIPEGAFVALRHRLAKRWPDHDALNNFDDEGGEHCPGWSMEALQFLYNERGIAMNGHETFDTDASYLAVEADDLACERWVLDNGHLQVEVMDNLDKVPATGAIVFVSWPRIEGATGLPARVIAAF